MRSPSPIVGLRSAHRRWRSDPCSRTRTRRRSTAGVLSAPALVRVVRWTVRTSRSCQPKSQSRVLTDSVESFPGIGNGHPRPVGEVVDSGRPTTREEASSERRESLFALESPGGWNPFVEQRIGELVPASRPTADDSVQFRTHQEVAHAELAVSRNAGRLKDDAQLIASQLVAAAQRSGEGRVAAPEGGVVELQLAVHVRVCRLHAWRR